MNSAWSLQKTQGLQRNSSAGVSKSNTVITALKFCGIIILFREDAADKFILISNATLLVLLLRATKRDHSQFNHAGERSRHGTMGMFPASLHLLGGENAGLTQSPRQF